MLLNSCFSQKYMVRRKIEEVNYTCIECLLYTFHHLAHKVRDIFWPWIIYLMRRINLLILPPCESYRLQTPQTVSVDTRLSLDSHQIDWGRISRSNIRTLLRGAFTCFSIPWCYNLNPVWLCLVDANFRFVNIFSFWIIEKKIHVESKIGYWPLYIRVCSKPPNF